MRSAAKATEDRTFRFGDLAFRTVLASEFDGAVSVFEVELGPGRLAGPLHVHDNEDAISYVLAGQLTFQVGGGVTEALAGESVALPRRVSHTFWNAGSEPARALDVVTPGGLENYYEELAGIVDTADAMDRVATMEARYGVRMDWDSIPELLARHGLEMAAS